MCACSRALYGESVARWWAFEDRIVVADPSDDEHMPQELCWLLRVPLYQLLVCSKHSLVVDSCGQHHYGRRGS